MKRGFSQQPKQGTATAGKLKLKYDEIKKGDIVAIIKDNGFSQSEVKSNVQIHQKSATPLSPDGDYRIECHETMMFSHILLSRFQKKNEMTGQMENQITLKTFMEIYGNYAVCDADGNHTTDPIGDSYAAAFRTIDESMAESIDANPTHKKRLLGQLKMGKKMNAALEAPMIEMMESFLKRSTIDDPLSPFNGEEDMSKSEVGAFQLWIGNPNQPSATDFKIPGTNLVIWTRIFDDTDRIAQKPISSWEHLMRFIYEKGDSQTKGRRPFRFAATCTLLPPSLYINSDKKVGKMQYKIAEMHIYEMDYAKPRNIMSAEEMALQRDRKMKAMGRFVTNPEPEQQTETNGQDAANDQTDAYQQQHYDDYAQQQDPDQDNYEVHQIQDTNEFDALIQEDQTMQRVTKKTRQTH